MEVCFRLCVLAVKPTYCAVCKREPVCEPGYGKGEEAFLGQLPEPWLQMFIQRTSCSFESQALVAKNNRNNYVLGSRHWHFLMSENKLYFDGFQALMVGRQPCGGPAPVQSTLVRISKKKKKNSVQGWNFLLFKKKKKRSRKNKGMQVRWLVWRLLFVACYQENVPFQVILLQRSLFFLLLASDCR